MALTNTEKANVTSKKRFFRSENPTVTVAPEIEAHIEDFATAISLETDLDLSRQVRSLVEFNIAKSQPDSLVLDDDFDDRLNTHERSMVASILTYKTLAAIREALQENSVKLSTTSGYYLRPSDISYNISRRASNLARKLSLPLSS